MDPLGFPREGSDFGQGGFGDNGDRELMGAAFAVLGEFNCIELMVKNGVLVAVQRSVNAQVEFVCGFRIVFIGSRG